MPGILLYADKANLAREMRTAAEAVAGGKPIKLAALSCDQGLAESGAADVCAIEVPVADVALIAHALADAVKALGCDTVIVAGDRRGKDLSGRLAQKLNAGVLTGVSSLDFEGGKIVASYPSLGGAVINRSTIESEYKVFAVSPNSYAECAPGSYEITSLATDAGDARVNVGEKKPREGSSVDVAAAEVLVVVGCGVENQADLEKIEAFAQSMGGVVGCTKPVATDRKWFSEDRIVGISGKTCAPRLAVLLGVSGQVQFWAGIRDAETIVSFNTDEHAAVVSLSDCSFVGDAVECIDEFLQAL